MKRILLAGATLLALSAVQPTLAAAARHLVPIDLADVTPGDVLLFRWRAHLPAKHAAILVATDRIVHAHDGAAVAEVYFASFWRRRLAYAFRFPEAGGR